MGDRAAELRPEGASVTVIEGEPAADVPVGEHVAYRGADGRLGAVWLRVEGEAQTPELLEFRALDGGSGWQARAEDLGRYVRVHLGAAPPAAPVLLSAAGIAVGDLFEAVETGRAWEVVELRDLGKLGTGVRLSAGNAWLWTDPAHLTPEHGFRRLELATVADSIPSAYPALRDLVLTPEAIEALEQADETMRLEGLAWDQFLGRARELTRAWSAA